VAELVAAIAGPITNHLISNAQLAARTLPIHLYAIRLAVIGVYVVLRRMAFIGDALAHDGRSRADRDWLRRGWVVCFLLCECLFGRGDCVDLYAGICGGVAGRSACVITQKAHRRHHADGAAVARLQRHPQWHNLVPLAGFEERLGDTPVNDITNDATLF
jgi:ABC 3 transport family